MPDDCKAKYEGEPTFTLVGRDKLALHAIKRWMEAAADEGVNAAKIDKSIEDYNKFVQWQMDNPDKVKLPD